MGSAHGFSTSTNAEQTVASRPSVLCLDMSFYTARTALDRTDFAWKFKKEEYKVNCPGCDT
eukprot:scaffold5893_cov32-Prasinocladus_malaysianus.AAC.1